MAQEEPKLRKPSNAYNIFILVLTVLSLAVMVVMLLPFISDETMKLLAVYDNLICVIFLIDFYLNMRGAGKKSDYFIKERGWLDLLGSIPSLGLLTNVGKFAGLFRLARLSRFARITRLLRGENKKALVKDVLDNRSRYATFITLLLTILVLTVASVLGTPIREQIAGCENHHRWGRPVVFDRDHHHRGLWRLLPRHCSRTNYSDVHHVHGRRHYRRAQPAFLPACWWGDRLRQKRKKCPQQVQHPQLKAISLRSKVSWHRCDSYWKK